MGFYVGFVVFTASRTFKCQKFKHHKINHFQNENLWLLSNFHFVEGGTVLKYIQQGLQSKWHSYIPNFATSIFVFSVFFYNGFIWRRPKKKHWRPWKGHKHRQGTRDSVALYQDQRNNQNRPRQKSSLRLSLELQDFPNKACGYVRLFWRINLMIIVMRWSNRSHSSKWQNKDMQWHSELRIPDCW